VPATHVAATQKLPAVSGSSGRLVIERLHEASPETAWPGRVFEDDQLSYVEAMMAFVEASHSHADSSPALPGSSDRTLTAQKRALRQEEAQLRASRRKIRQKRREQDEIWRMMRQVYRTMASSSNEDMTWLKQAQHGLRQHRKRLCAQRQIEDVQWRQQRQSLRTRQAEVPGVTAWIAILVITDNCTRSCPGLPLFVAGPHVTADALVDALREMLPPTLQFLITDRGSHFRAKVFEALAHCQEFIHVMVARHRPQSNGIAERFIRTLKEWLYETSWTNDQELARLLAQFVAEYNERPHQGLPLPGLSPQEFATRLWLY